MREDLQLLSYAAFLEFEAVVDSSGMHSPGVPNNQYSFRHGDTLIWYVGNIGSVVSFAVKGNHNVKVGDAWMCCDEIDGVMCNHCSYSDLKTALETEFANGGWYTVESMREDIKGKLIADNAKDLSEEEIERVFGTVVSPSFCIAQARKAALAGITIEHIYTNIHGISLDAKKKYATDAGWQFKPVTTQQGISTGTGFYALPPGEIEFIAEDVEAGTDSNYLGFFSSEKEMVEEVYTEMMSIQQREMQFGV